MKEIIEQIKWIFGIGWEFSHSYKVFGNSCLIYRNKKTDEQKAFMI